jgi:PAS domain S-box-containing protein
VVFHDINERKRVEDALRESEEQYRTLFEKMAQGIVNQDAAGRIINANSAAERILGLSLDQMQGRTSVDPRWRAVHQDGSDFSGETHPAIVALRTGKEVRDVVIGVFNPAKEAYSWIMINAVPQFHPGQERSYQVFTIFDDITERKQAEEALRESHERFQLANRATFNAIWDWNLQTDALWWNENFQVLFGYRAEEIEPGI